MNIRTFYGTDYVLKSDYRVNLGSLVGGDLPGDADAAPDGRPGEECGAIVHGIKPGMFIDVTNQDGDTLVLRISDSYASNLGTSVYCDTSKN